MKCCETCAWVTDERDPDEDEPSFRCAYPVPFSVPSPTLDYGSWVHADYGAECRAYKTKQPPRPEPGRPIAGGGIKV